MTVPPIRVAVLGTGFFGTALARAAHTHPQFTLAVVSDLDPTSAAALAGSLGARTLDPRDLPAHGDVELVMVATPNHTHADTAVALLAAGRHVFVEKPLAITRADIEAVLAAAERSAGRLMVGHMLRCLPGIKRLQQEVTSGALGHVLEGRAVRSRLVHLPDGAENWWKLDRGRSGGELLHEIHELDLLIWIFGEPVTATCISGATPQPTAAAPPSVHRTTLTFADDAVAVHELSTSAHHAEWSLRVSGTEAAIVADFRTSSVTKYVDGAPTEQWQLFDDPGANRSLQESAQARQAYNAPGATGPVWMQEAIRTELDEVAAAIREGGGVLLAHPGTAVLTAVAAETSHGAVPA